MTYLDYVKIVCPGAVCDSGFVSGCPDTHGLPSCNCGDVGSCAACYAQHEIPDDEALELIIANYASSVPEWVSQRYAELTPKFELASDDEIEEILGVYYG